MRYSKVAMMLLSASALVGCKSAEPTHPVSLSSSEDGLCVASVNSEPFVTPVSYKLAAVHSAGAQPTSFWISCQSLYSEAELIAFAPYPPRIGTTVYSSDSLSALSGGYFSPGGVSFVTWGAGTSGSITITAWDSTTGAVSGHFSFTAKALSPYGGSVPPTSTPVVASGSFADALIAR